MQNLELKMNFCPGIMSKNNVNNLFNDLYNRLSDNFTPEEISKKFIRKFLYLKKSQYDFIICAKKPFLKIETKLRTPENHTHSDLIITTKLDPLAGAKYATENPLDFKALEVFGHKQNDPYEITCYMEEHPIEVLNYYLFNIIALMNEGDYGEFPE